MEYVTKTERRDYDLKAVIMKENSELYREMTTVDIELERRRLEIPLGLTK